MALKLKSKADETAQAPDEQPVSHTSWPSAAKPSAMLVPTYIRENRALAVTKRQALYGFVVVMVLVAAAVAGSFLLNMMSKSALDDAVADKKAAQADVNRLAPIANYYDGLEQRGQATVALLAGDVRHADLFKLANAAVPAGGRITAYTTALGTPCPGDDPFTATDSIGCINLNVEVDSRDKVAAMIESLKSASEDGLVQGAFVTSVQAEDDLVRFSVDMNFTSKSLSMKYVPADSAPPEAADATQEGVQ